eukprot:4907272-Amphidinium_carterae.1
MRHGDQGSIHDQELANTPFLRSCGKSSTGVYKHSGIMSLKECSSLHAAELRSAFAHRTGCATLLSAPHLSTMPTFAGCSWVHSGRAFSGRQGTSALRAFQLG